MGPRSALLAAAVAIFISTLSAPAVRAQQNPLRFDSVDIRIAGPNTIPYMRSRFLLGRYELRNASLLDLISTAWNVDADNVTGGPEWLDENRFDVTAAAPAISTPEALHALLQTMLADRFQLVVRKGSKDFPAYEITARKKTQLHEADPSIATGCAQQLNPNAVTPTPSAPFPPVTFDCHNMSLAAFADAIAAMSQLSGYLFGYPVLDHTSLKGEWDFSFRFSPRYSGTPRRPASDSITIFDALDRLGLKLSPTTAPVPVIVVENVSPTPGGILGTATPADLPQFEVAAIKRDMPDDRRGTSVGLQRGGEVRIRGTLRGLIAEAWGDMNHDHIVDAPKFIDDIQWLITAKTVAESSGISGLYIDNMRMMLRSLLIERFALKAHEEHRLIPGYALVAAKPKLRMADPVNRHGCHQGPGADGKDPRIANPLASMLITCWNMTLSQFTAEFGGYLYYLAIPPITDATGLKGRYDITINFTPPRFFANLPGPDPFIGSDAPEPDGAITLSNAFSRQLGLKLEPRKVKGPVLVIDHVNEMPTEN